MLHDWDKVQAHEFEQQQLVERIISSLHNATHDEEDYRKTFFDIAECILLELREKPTLAHASVLEFKKYVQEPINAFAKTPAELKYLFLKVFEKVFASVASGIISAYNSETMGLVSAGQSSLAGTQQTSC